MDSSLTPTDRASAAHRAVAALSAGGDATIVGAPGTGRTTALRGVFNELLRERAQAPDDVVVLTPNRESAAQLRDVLGSAEDSAVLGLPAPGPLASALRHGPAARSIHSFAFGIVGARAAAVDGDHLRFISGPDQDSLLAGLLSGYESGLAPAPPWPARFGPEVRGTAGFRNQLREILNEVMGQGFTQADVLAAAQRQDRPEWRVVAHALQDYADLLAVPGFGGVDTAEVFEQARWALVDEDSAGTAAGGSWSFSAETVPRYVLIDGAQDLPDAALGMVRALSALGTRMLFTVSPDAGTQGFRGARGELLDAILTEGSGPHATIVLDEGAPAARGAGAIRLIVDGLARRISSRTHLGHLTRNPADLPQGGTRALARTVDSQAERTRAVAAQLRAWHAGGAEWEDCAVITRTTGTARALEGELEYLGIPVAAAVQALGADPATAPLLRLLARPAPEPAERSAQLKMLLTGVYIGLDPIALRGVERGLGVLLAARDAAGEAAAGSAGPQAAAVADAEVADTVADSGAPTAEAGTRAPLGDVWSRAAAELDPASLPAPVARALGLLEAAAAHALHDPHAALWSLWQATGVADRWRDRAIAHPADPAGARIDAVLRLMTLAEKDAELADRTARAFAGDVLEQRFAQDSLARRADDDHVQVVAAAAVAHREFGRVIVVDLEEGVWPNPRVRGSVFASDSLLDELKGLPPVSDAQAAYRESRRLTIRDEARLALAAMSRAKEELVLIAIADGDTLPSVLFDTAVAAGAVQDRDESGAATAGTAAAGATAFAPGGLSLLTATDVAAYARHRFEQAEPGGEAELRFAQLLQSLAGAGVRAAGPDGWLDWQDVSLRKPLLGPRDTARISPSAVELFHDCQLRWLLTRHGGQTTGTSAQYLGTLVHAIAEHHPHGGLIHMLRDFEEGFADLQFPSSWEREREYRAGREMISNLQDYLSGRSALGHELVGTEGKISATHPEGDDGGPWTINGRIDRLESDRDGRLYVVDFKTGRHRPTAAEAAANSQLATYQVALDNPHTAVTFAEGSGDADTSDGAGSLGERRVTAAGGPGGAELVFVRYPGTTTRGVPANVRAQAAPADGDDPDWAADLVARTAAGMRSEVFTATPSRTTCTGCPVRTSCPVAAGEDDPE